MNLLFLLSAILSALTGVGQAVRGPRAPQAVCASVAAVQPAAVRTIAVAARPVAPWPSRLAAPVAAAVFRLVAAEPIFATRRRE